MPKKVVNAVIFNGNGRYLLKKAADPRYGDRWGFPRKTTELWEDTEDTARVTAFEEAGVQVEPGGRDYRETCDDLEFHHYLCIFVSGEAIDHQASWFSMDEIRMRQDLVPYVKKTIERLGRMRV